jgi:hypothetical protein
MGVFIQPGHTEGDGSCGRKEWMEVHTERGEREPERGSEIHADEERHATREVKDWDKYLDRS